METIAADLTPDLGRSTDRTLHPLAWWAWALCLAGVASATTNPLVLGLLIAVAGLVVAARRQRAPWAAAFRYALWTGLFIVIVRVLFRIVFGGDLGTTVLLDLPSLSVPGVEGGVRLLGDVTAESLLSGFYDGLRLAAIVIAVGAASALANPRRLLRSLPSSLHEVGTALVVAVSVFPQLVESVARVRAARRIRPSVETGRIERLRSVIVPVLEDSLERSILLAASMDARGYGRTGGASLRRARVSGALLVGGLVVLGAGIYSTLDTTSPRWMATPLLVFGGVVATIGGLMSGADVVRTAYRPDLWRAAESVTALCGVVALAGVLVVRHFDRAVLHTQTSPLAWPELPMAVAGLLAVAALPAMVTPRPDQAVGN
jgi:energy-coupling factor transport system permease protein